MLPESKCKHYRTIFTVFAHTLVVNAGLAINDVTWKSITQHRQIDMRTLYPVQTLLQSSGFMRDENFWLHGKTNSGPQIQHFVSN